MYAGNITLGFEYVNRKNRRISIFGIKLKSDIVSMFEMNNKFV